MESLFVNHTLCDIFSIFIGMVSHLSKCCRRVLWALCAVSAVVLVAVFSAQDVRGLASAAGIFVYILIMFVCSKNPAKVSV